MFTDLLYRLRAIFRRSAVEQELDQELRFHLEKEAEKHVRAGVSSEEAIRLARLALQGPEQTKERVRDARGTALWESMCQDLRYTFRQMRASPGFTVVAVVILALGIGANTAIFSLLNALMLRSLPVRDPQLLIVPRWTANETPHPYDADDFDSCIDPRVKGAQGSCTFPYPIFKLMEAKREFFSSTTAYLGPMAMNASGDGRADVIQAQVVANHFFQTLGVRPVLGRTLDPDASTTAVLSYAYWEKAFGDDRNVIGKTIRLNDVPYTIIGVAEPRFNHLSPGHLCDVWVPLRGSDRLGLSWLATPWNDEHHFWLRIVARLKPGVTAARAESALTALFRHEMISESKVFKADSTAGIEVAPANTALVGVREVLERPLYVLTCAVGLILLIACTNVAGLLISRAAARQREIAIRLSVGAARSRLVRQLLTESLVLAALGGMAGLGVAQWGTLLLTRFLGRWGLLDVKPDRAVFIFTAVAALGSGLFFGIIPALHSTRMRSPAANSNGLQHSMAGAASRGRFRNLLVVAQVAIAVVLLVGAGLFLRTLHNLTSIDPGFNPRNLLLFAIDPVTLHYREPQVQSLYRNLRERLAGLPGVTGVTYSRNVLLSGSLSSSGFKIEGSGNQDERDVYRMEVGPDFFETIGIPVVAGRAFSPEESAQARKVAVVNNAFVRQYLHGRNPIGLHFGEGTPADGMYQIIGVSGDAKYDSLRTDVHPTAYMPLGNDATHFEVRTAGDPLALIPEVRRILSDADPNLPLSDLKTQSEQIDDLLVIERLIARLTGVFGLLALSLACVGIYGLLSYEVARRTREIGIRMAVGAAPGRVQAGVLRETLGIVVLGLVIGIPVALLAARAVAAMLYGIRADDPVTLAGMTLVLLTVSGVAGYIPARRASLVDPMAALRSE